MHVGEGRINKVLQRMEYRPKQAFVLSLKRLGEFPYDLAARNLLRNLELLFFLLLDLFFELSLAFLIRSGCMNRQAPSNFRAVRYEPLVFLCFAFGEVNLDFRLAVEVLQKRLGLLEGTAVHLTQGELNFDCVWKTEVVKPML